MTTRSANERRDGGRGVVYTIPAAKPGEAPSKGDLQRMLEEAARNTAKLPIPEKEGRST